MSTLIKTRTLTEEIESLNASPHFVWWILAFAGYIGSQTSSFFSEKEANEFAKREDEKPRKEYLAPEHIRLIRVLTPLLEHDGQDKIRVRLLEICEWFNKGTRRMDQITPRKAGSLLKRLGLRTKKGAKGYTYAILDKVEMAALKQRAIHLPDPRLQQFEETRYAKQSLQKLRITSNLFMRGPIPDNPSHRPVNHPKYEAIYYLRAYFKKCSMRSHMTTIQRILQTASAVEMVKAKLNTGELVSRHCRPRTADYRKLNIENFARCCYKIGIDETKFYKIMGFIDDELVAEINAARFAAPEIINDWNTRRPSCIRKNVDFRGNGFKSIEEHLSFYKRHREKIDAALRTGKIISSFWNKTLPKDE